MYSKHHLICLQKTLLKESFYNKFQARVKSSMAQNHKGLFQGRHIKRLSKLSATCTSWQE